VDIRRWHDEIQAQVRYTQTRNLKEIVSMENTQNTRQLVNTVFKAVAVGMSIAAIVLGVLLPGNLPLLITLLSIGLFCLAVASLK
jgi:hypothetical protein